MGSNSIENIGVNNIDLIKEILKFDNVSKGIQQDTFYHVQILKRKKEHKELGRNSVVVKTYYITSIEYLESKIDEIGLICREFNARAYINVNARSFEDASYKTLEKIGNQLMNRDFYNVRKSYESAVGSLSTKNGYDKLWVLDIDDVDINQLEDVRKEIDKIPPFNCCKHIIPTKNGFHIISKPFNVTMLKAIEDKLNIPIGVQKNNPTLLYYVKKN